MNLYEVLGVAKDAVKSEIKKAFKKKAQESHPDRAGGDIKVFQQVNAAYEVLSDDERRKRYDETGDTGRPQSEQSKAEELIIGLFASIIEQEDFSGNLIERSRKVIIEKAAELQKQLNKLTKKIEKLTKQTGRIKTESENMFQIVLERSIDQCNEHAKALEENLALLQIVDTLLDPYQDSSPQIDAQPTFNMSEQFIEMMRRQRATGFGGFDRG